MLPQEATTTCDQVHQLRGLCRFCHAQLWEETLVHLSCLLPQPRYS
jgi:hypothetical protein